MSRYQRVREEYTIDLSLDEDERWQEVIAADWRVARKLVKEAKADYDAVYSEAVQWLAGKTFRALYDLFGGHYGGEISSWADAIGVDEGIATIANCTYEVSGMACTAGVRWVPGLGMCHVRNMDWPLKAIAPGTRIFRFVDEDREFYSVGIVGFVGVLSGMVPGGYSATLNWAPVSEWRGFGGWGPAFLLRHVLENADTYDEAVAMLRATELAAPAFFTVCGVHKGEACVVERTREDAAVRTIKGPVLIQGNHHVARKFVHLNELIAEGDVDEDGEELESMLDDSTARTDCLEERLSEVTRAPSLAVVARSLGKSPVTNDQSYQKMAFCPRTGEVLAWRRVG